MLYSFWGTEFNMKSVNITQFLYLHSVFAGKQKFSQAQLIEMTLLFFADLGEEDMACDQVLELLSRLLNLKPGIVIRRQGGKMVKEVTQATNYLQSNDFSNFTQSRIENVMN